MKLHLLLIFLLCTSSAAAFTISPAKFTFDTPGTHNFTITVRGEEEGIAQIRAEGDLAPNIQFDALSKELNGETQFRGSITIPEDIVPGDHGQQIIVSLEQAQTGALNTRIELASVLTARRLFDGAYLTANFYSSPDYGTKNSTTIYFTLENKGNADVTPTAIIIEAREKTSVTPRSIRAGEAAQFSATLSGQGEYPLILRVEGAAPLEEHSSIALGHPTITELQAAIVEETGAITPITIDVAVAWNKPVMATLTIAGKSQDITIDRKLRETFYTETSQENISILVTLGPEAREVQLRRMVGAPTKSSYKWIIITLGIIILLGLLYWYRRRRAETFI
jgi:hypothetical protein